MERRAFDFRFLADAGRDPAQSYSDLHDRGTVIPDTAMWLVVGYDAAASVLRDHTNFSSEIALGLGGGPFGKTMVFVDPPDHTRLRGVIDEREIRGACALLFVAGNVTTTSLLGNAVLALSRYRDECRLLAGDPLLIPNALEEVFRFDPPVPAIPPRRTIVETSIDGHVAPIGTHVVVHAAAANRDPKRFADPDRFDVTRADAANHLAFGAGIHYCLGAPLSRLEAKVAMEELLDRVPSLELAIPHAEAQYDGSSFLRAPRRVPITV